MHGRLFVNFFTLLFKEWYSIVLKISHLSASLLTEVPDFRFSYNYSFPAIFQLGGRAEDFISQTYSLQFTGEDRTGAIKMDGIFITIKIKNFCIEFL